MRRQCVAVSIVSSYLLGGSLEAQTQVDITQLKNLDLTRKGTILFRTGSSLPATCVPGEALLRTDAMPGMNLYVCLSANTWVVQMNGQTFALTATPGAAPIAGPEGKLDRSWIDSSGYQTPLGYTPLDRAANLSDIASAAAARANMGLGSAAVKGVHGTGGALAAFAGGVTIANDCVMFDAAGNLADSGAPCGTGGSAGAPNYAQGFSGQTTIAITHNLNSSSILVQCFDSSDNLLIPNSVTLTSANTATVAFSTAQTGKCVVNSSGGGGAAGASSFAAITGVATIEQGGTGQITRGAAFDALAPSAAKGDTIVFDGETNRRVGAGPDGSCWIADSTQAAGVRWGSCSGVTSGAGLALAGTVLSIDAATVPTFLTGAASLTFGNLSNGSCGARTFSLTGAATGDGVAPGWPASLEPGLLGTIRVSAADTVEVRLCNFSGIAITPADGQTFRATVVRSF